MERSLPSQVNPDRAVSVDLGDINKDNAITVSVSDETFSGPVTRIDSYSDGVDVERVIQFNISFKQYLDGPEWEPWKVYLVKEPAGVYRANLMLYDGEKSRTRNLDAPDEIVVDR